jgi:hypothetical protein
MRPSRQTLFSLFATILVSLSVTIPGQAAQLPAQLPSKWNDAVHTLAGKIAIGSGGPGKIAFDFKNISSLNSADSKTIRQALKDDLTQRHMRFATMASAETQVTVTLSEGTEGLIWAGEIRHGDERQVVIVVVPKSGDGSGDRTKESLSLDRRLIWEQQAKVLDFALFNSSAGASATLAILEPDRMVFYHTVESQWQLWRTADISHPGPWPRDVRGSIDFSANKLWLSGVQCSCDFEHPDHIECIPQTKAAEPSRIFVPGHEGSEVVTISGKCGSGYVTLASGTGDWTQPDSVQGYVSGDSQGQAVASGDPVAFDGPVISLKPGEKDGAARAVVFNLETGNYEAYIVTATCSY